MKKIQLIISLVALMATLTASGQTVWWGLWNTGQGLKQRSPLYGGRNELAVRLTPQNSPLLVGGQVSGLRFWLSDKAAVTSARVWIATSNGSGTIAEQEVDVASLRDIVHDNAPTEVIFDAAYDVLPPQNRYAQLYCGVTLQLLEQPLTYLMASPGSGVAGSCYYGGQDISATYGALALQVLAQGPLVARAAEAPQPIGEQVAVGGTTATTTLTVAHQGYEPVNSIGYVATIDGTPQPEQTYQLPLPATELGLNFTVPVSYSVPTEATEHTLQVALTSVNGQPYPETPESPTAAEVPSTTLIALSHEPLKRTVMEEFTGTWCHNCVRGMVGIDLLEQQYPDQFIAIAMHSDERDPMMVGDYRSSQFFRDAQRVLGGLPSCAIDRWALCDPYCGYDVSGGFMTDKIVDEALRRTAVADLAVTATYTDDTQTRIGLDATTTFAYSSSDAHYSLILVTTADGLTGEGQRWQQRNGYDEYTGDDPNLTPFAGRGQYLTDMSYSHVAVAIEGVDGGISGSIAAPLTADSEQHYRCTLDIGQNTIVQDRQRLSVVAMLIDTRNGQVVNAAKAPVQAATAISATPACAAPLPQHAYDLQGRRVKQPAQPGLYIIKGKKTIVADGSHIDRQ